MAEIRIYLINWMMQRGIMLVALLLVVHEATGLTKSGALRL
jgi:hypothetical protein